MPQVLTANRLAIGEVVYWTGQGWAPRLEDAKVLEDAAAEAVLKAAEEWVTAREVVGLYLFDVRIENGRTVPVKIREVIRAAGPTVRLDLGKQAH